MSIRPEDHKVDRSTFPSGEWDNEPDRKDWTYLGFPCMAIRNRSGNWCGYVGVPPGHPLHGFHMDAVGDLEVHGGITYAKACGGHICHTPKPGEPDNVWWLGFDCGHLGDTIPAFLTLMPNRAGIFGFPHATYKNLAYVINEVQSLAEQLCQKPNT